MNYYASKRFLVQVERPEQEGEIHTIHGTLPVKPNDILATDEFGVQFVMSDKHFHEHYVPVKKIETKPRKPKMSPFEQEEFIKALLEQSSMPSQFESEEYIIGQKALLKK